MLASRLVIQPNHSSLFFHFRKNQAHISANLVTRVMTNDGVGKSDG